MRTGARYLGDNSCEFTVWAPLANRVELLLVSPPGRVLPMEPGANGYWRKAADGVKPGARYLYRIDGTADLPDPASLSQPEGVHAPSAVVDHAAYRWDEGGWRGMVPADTVIYELHVGTFSREGTFDAVIPRLGQLKELGITALELMPVAQFPGERNWGYDGVYPNSVHYQYGGPEGLKRLVSACHRTGMAVILDVVYNHLGPEGNYLARYGPYFTDRSRTPWGDAVNLDGAGSDEVRDFLIENALHWFRDYRMDALRLDAVHGLTPPGAGQFLRELAHRVRDLSIRSGKRLFLTAESNLNDPAIVTSAEAGGLGLDAQWCDDFHHSLHALLTRERDGYYQDFGRLGDLAATLREGFAYSGRYSRYRGRSYGASARGIPAERFIVCAQNHDQIGNRPLGERLSRLVSFEALKLAAGVLLLSPYIPLLFMGEEYGEEAPFLYFVDHSDPALLEAVRRGRRAEFEALGLAGEPPDPAGVETFLASKLRWEQRELGRHRLLSGLYRRLLGLRRELPCLAVPDNSNLEAFALEGDGILFLRRWRDGEQVVCIGNFSRRDRRIRSLPAAGEWARVIDTADAAWGGPGTRLPEKARGSEALLMRGESFALFRGKGGD